MKKLLGAVLLIGGSVLLSIFYLKLDSISFEEKSQILASGSLGSAFTIIGIIFVLTKTAKRRRMEEELAALKYIRENGLDEESKAKEIERLFALKEKGALTEVEFINEKKKVLKREEV